VPAFWGLLSRAERQQATAKFSPKWRAQTDYKPRAGLGPKNSPFSIYFLCFVRYLCGLPGKFLFGMLVGKTD
jgi:hypothetical protein